MGAAPMGVGSQVRGSRGSAAVLTVRSGHVQVLAYRAHAGGAVASVESLRSSLVESSAAPARTDAAGDHGAAACAAGTLAPPAAQQPEQLMENGRPVQVFATPGCTLRVHM